MNSSAARAIRKVASFATVGSSYDLKVRKIRALQDNCGPRLLSKSSALGPEVAATSLVLGLTGLSSMYPHLVPSFNRPTPVVRTRLDLLQREVEGR